jgi:predicted transposase/invertase (TIGR01784 family)
MLRSPEPFHVLPWFASASEMCYVPAMKPVSFRPVNGCITMLIGIRPINDFAFKKTFGSPENKLALISLLNSILELPKPIVDVTIENPYSLQDFKDDKLSILDIKAIDQTGAIYDVEMQLSIFTGLIQRIVFYGCEIYTDQLRSGDDYALLKPAYSICLLDGVLWHDSTKVHHAFRFTDLESGRTLNDTLEIHTIELGRYHLQEKDLATASLLECWVYWLLHAHEYEPEALLKLFPQEAIRQATQTITQIAQVTEDKAMYDAREKAIRDRQWELNASRKEGKIEGKIEGEIKTIRVLQEILQIPLSTDSDFDGKSLDDLQSLTADLQERVRQRHSS